MNSTPLRFAPPPAAALLATGCATVFHGSRDDLKAVAVDAEGVEHRGERAAALEEIARPVPAEPGDGRRDGSEVRESGAHFGPPRPGVVLPGHAPGAARLEPDRGR